MISGGVGAALPAARRCASPSSTSIVLVLVLNPRTPNSAFISVIRFASRSEIRHRPGRYHGDHELPRQVPSTRTLWQLEESRANSEYWYQTVLQRDLGIKLALVMQGTDGAQPQRATRGGAAIGGQEMHTAWGSHGRVSFRTALAHDLNGDEEQEEQSAGQGPLAAWAQAVHCNECSGGSWC